MKQEVKDAIELLEQEMAVIYWDSPDGASSLVVNYDLMESPNVSSDIELVNDFSDARQRRYKRMQSAGKAK